MTSHRFGASLTALVGLAGILFAPPVSAQTSELVDRTTLRICADPNDLPFSNEQGEGFENKIAAILGTEFGLPVSYTWFPQGPGFVKNTLGLRRCDLATGVVAGDDIMATTTPYYYSTFVMMTRSDGPKITGMDDPQLAKLTIGVVANTPPVNLMINHNLMAKMHSYALVVDTRAENPAHQMVQDLAKGTIDVALVWGPIGGYYAKHDKLAVTIAPLKAEPGSPRLDFRIAMGVRGAEPEWRRKVGAALTKHRDEINAVLADYGIPLLDEQGQLIQAPTKAP